MIIIADEDERRLPSIDARRRVTDIRATECLAPGTQVLEWGFSQKVHDRRISQLIADAILGVRLSSHARSRSLRDNDRARSGALQSEQMARTPLLTRDDLLRAFMLVLQREGIPLEVALRWPALVAQTRISRLEVGGGSTSPGRQAENIAEWCVEYRLRPDWLVHEEVSGSIYRPRRRMVFENFYDDVKADRVRDSHTGAPITEAACFLLDRFTRDPEEGGPWLTLMRQKGMNLHETYYGEPPRPLHQTEHEIRDAWNRASKEVERTRERIMNALEALAKQGLPTYGRRRLIGHRAVRKEVDGQMKTVGYTADPEEASRLQWAAAQIIDGATEYSVFCALTEAGFTNAAGNPIALNSFRNVLRSPRLFGGLRLKTDRRRLHGDSDYAGDLYPQELIYEHGEAPAPGFVAPIEPILPYPVWVDLQVELARRSTKSGPRVKHLASGYLTCGACRGPETAGGVAYHCPKRHLIGIHRVNADRANKIAEDGHRHPTMRIHIVDEVISEVLFAAVDASVNQADLRPTVDLEAIKVSIDAKIAALDARLADNSYMLNLGNISRATYDEWCEEIRQERQVLRGELGQLAPPNPLTLIPEGTTLRDVWPNMSVEQRRRVLDVVIERVVLLPASNIGSRAIVGRLEFVFKDNYEPPADELNALLRDLETRINRRRATNRLSKDVEDRILELHEDGLSTLEIAETLTAEGLSRPSDVAWTTKYLVVVLRRLCGERRVKYVANQRDRSKIPYETRELIVALAEKLENHAAVARELNELGLTRHGDKPWTARSVGGALEVQRNQTRRRSGAPKPVTGLGRRSHLSDATRERIWELHRVEGMSVSAICRWLESAGIKTASGKESWSGSTVYAIVRSLDARDVAVAADSDSS